MRYIRIFITGIMAVACGLCAMAVTDKEMDEARAITAKEYLRWVNDGSGYLDEFEVKSMSELNSKLKAKEKENIKAFNAVAVPKDYASWNKDKLVEYWGVTFFQSAGLDAKGKGARLKVRKKLQSIRVGAPEVDSESLKEETSSEPKASTAPNLEPQSVTESQNEEAPSAENAVEEQEDILADQKAIDQDRQEADGYRQEEKSNTWVYVLVLAILVGIVIWLVVYAANVMKRQPREEDVRGDNDELREQAKAAISKKNAEIDEYKERLKAEENKSAALSAELETLKREHSRLLQQIQSLRDEHTRPAREEAAPAPRVREKESAPANNIIPIIYLGRTNRRGIFVRADRRINPGNTVYRLDTNDGLVGTFHVVDEPEVVDVAISNPTEYLEGGCICDDLLDTECVTRIITESSGTAIFENGYWKVLRKSKIRYE